MNMGVARHQLVGGLAFHGRGFTIISAKHVLGTRSIGPSRPRLVSAEVGFIANFEVLYYQLQATHSSSNSFNF